MRYGFWKGVQELRSLESSFDGGDLNHTRDPGAGSGALYPQGLQCGALFNLGGVMKQWAWILAIPVLISLAVAQTQTSASPSSDESGSPASSGIWHEAGPRDRMFFPKDMLWGWAQFDLSPPHNETDPNLCAGNSYVD